MSFADLPPLAPMIHPEANDYAADANSDWGRAALAFIGEGRLPD